MGEEPVDDLDRLVGVVHRDVDVHPEDQLAARDVLELVDQRVVAVLRRDPLALEEAERVVPRSRRGALVARDVGRTRAGWRARASRRRRSDTRVSRSRAPTASAPELRSARARLPDRVEHRLDVLHEVEALGSRSMYSSSTPSVYGSDWRRLVVQHAAARRLALARDRIGPDLLSAWPERASSRVEGVESGGQAEAEQHGEPRADNHLRCSPRFCRQLPCGGRGLDQQARPRGRADDADAARAGQDGEKTTHRRGPRQDLDLDAPRGSRRAFTTTRESTRVGSRQTSPCARATSSLSSRRRRTAWSGRRRRSSRQLAQGGADDLEAELRLAVGVPGQLAVARIGAVPPRGSAGR